MGIRQSFSLHWNALPINVESIMVLENHYLTTMINNSNEKYQWMLKLVAENLMRDGIFT